MSIVSVKRIRANRNSTLDLRLMRAQTGYQVITDDPETSELEIRRADGIPRVGDLHPEEPRLSVVYVETGDPDDSGLVWRDVKVKYEAQVNGKNEGDNTGPLDLPAEISGAGRKTQEPIDIDLNSNIICNAVGEPFDPPVTETFTDLELTVTKNFANIDIVDLQDYVNAWNSDTFLGFIPGQCLMDDIRWTRVVTPSLIYYRVTFVVLVRKPEVSGQDVTTVWWKRIKNEGYYYKNSDGKIVRALDDAGKPTVLPVPLKLNGERITATAESNGFPTFSQTVPFLDFKTKKDKVFASLNIF